MTTAHAWDVFRFDGFDPLSSDPRQQRRIVTAAQRRVRLLRRPKIIFYAEVNLNFTTRKPAATALGQFGGFAISVMPSTSTKKRRAVSSPPDGMASCT